MEAEGSLVGRTLAGRFRIDKRIGRGGMATVYAAHVESGDRAGTQVALKVVNRELTRDPTVLRRFHREAKSASTLKHPNTVEVYEYGVDGADAFIAMELAEGQDLLQALSAENPMRQARAAFIVAQICAGLTEAHSHGIIHRDLKPENVMLVPTGQPGVEHVKVLDFGIAKMVESPKPAGSSDDDPPSYVTKTALTRVGTIVGTPSYMSPEQCRGGDLDGRSDVYSCGVLLYQILTGEVPFSGETPLHTAMRHIHAQPKPPSQLRKDLSPALEKIVLKALAKWPGERHQTAAAMRDELLAFLPSLPEGQDLLARQAAGSHGVVGNSPSPEPSSVVIPGNISDNAKPEAEVGATELVIPTDPRMGFGALGAGKLGSVRLSSAGAKSTTPSKPPSAPESATAPNAAASAGTTAPSAARRAPAPTGATPTNKITQRSAAAKSPVVQTGAQLASSSSPSRDTSQRDKAPRPLATTLKGVSTPSRDTQTEPSATAPSAAAAAEAAESDANDETPTGARHPPNRKAPHAVESETLHTPPRAPSRPPRGTQTGLTPTAQMARARLATAEARALEPDTPIQEDDEPRTFIRNPPASVPTPRAYGPTDEPSYEERPPARTLVMDPEPQGKASPKASPLPNSSLGVALAPTQLPPMPPSYDDTAVRAAHARAQAALQAQVAMDQSLSMSVSVSRQGSPSFGAPPASQQAQGPVQPQQGQPLIPSGTVRMPPEASKAAAAAAYQVSSYPIETKRKGRLDELSRGAVLLIGISLGLLVALIGLLIVIFTK